MRLYTITLNLRRYQTTNLENALGFAYLFGGEGTKAKSEFVKDCPVIDNVIVA
jgi:hypothetical protein